MVEGDTREYTTDDWKIYFMQVRRFLVNYTKEHIAPKFQKPLESQAFHKSDDIQYPSEEVRPEDIPF